MKKICRQCNKVFDHLTVDDMYCDDCGGTLSEMDKHISSTDIPSTQIQQDNRIHKGDKVNVGGDNFNAQSVDNRTVTTNIQNIQNIMDDTKKVVQCELSGRMVTQLDAAKCPSCKRCVALVYYVEKYRLCQECYEKKYGPLEEETKPVAPAPTTSSATAAPSTSSIPASSATSKAGIPPMVQTSGNRQVNIPMEPIRDGEKKKSKVWIYVLLAVLVAGGAFWMMKGNSEEVTPPKDNATVVAGEEPSSSEVTTAQPAPKTQPTTQPVVQPAPKTQETQAVAKAESSQPVVAESKDQFTLGKEAFDAGNYTKASVLLEQALSSGKSGAAYYLAVMNQQGKGVSKNARKAFGYMKQSAESGYSAAFYELAEMYRTGVGTEANRSQAKGWYEKAVASDTKDADKAATALNKYYR